MFPNNNRSLWQSPISDLSLAGEKQRLEFDLFMARRNQISESQSQMLKESMEHMHKSLERSMKWQDIPSLQNTNHGEMMQMMMICTQQAFKEKHDNEKKEMQEKIMRENIDREEGERLYREMIERQNYEIEEACKRSMLQCGALSR